MEASVETCGMDSAKETWGHRAGRPGSRRPPYHSSVLVFSMIGGVGFVIRAQEDPLDLYYYACGIGHREILPISRVYRREYRNRPLESSRSDAAIPGQ